MSGKGGALGMMRGGGSRWWACLATGRRRRSGCGSGLRGGVIEWLGFCKSMCFVRVDCALMLFWMMYEYDL